MTRIVTYAHHKKRPQPSLPMRIVTAKLPKRRRQGVMVEEPRCGRAWACRRKAAPMGVRPILRRHWRS